LAASVFRPYYKKQSKEAKTSHGVQGGAHQPVSQTLTSLMGSHTDTPLGLGHVVDSERHAIQIHSDILNKPLANPHKLAPIGGPSKSAAGHTLPSLRHGGGVIIEAPSREVASRTVQRLDTYDEIGGFSKHGHAVDLSGNTIVQLDCSTVINVMWVR
jgi:hypothetical protein